jgi:hypothetical protein
MATFIWTQKQDIGPGPRSSHAMAYDAARRQVLLFGGVLPTALAADTWAWDGRFWTQVADTGPSPRFGHALAFDAQRGRVVLFGGFSDKKPFMNDTWEWDGADWTQVADTGPAGRVSMGLAYDPRLQRTVLFGGQVRSLQENIGDTWSWDGADWTQVADTGPLPRESMAMAHAREAGTIVLFGGVNFGFVGAGAGLGDTWAFDGQAWRKIADMGPRPVFRAALADTGAGLILFGGAAHQGLNGPFGIAGQETWRFAASRWTQIQDIGPSPRSGHAMAFDEDRGALVLFGGAPLRASAEDPAPPRTALLGDTWELPAPAGA